MSANSIEETNIDRVNEFLATLEKRNLEAVSQFLADDVELVQPMTFSGSAEAAQMFRPQGRVAVLGYFQSVVTNFSQVRFTDREVNSTADGTIVFVEARGDLIISQSGQAYHNVYLFKFKLNEQGQLWHISEYANPVTAGQALGIPLGQV